MNSGGEPERDDTGLPPVDIEIPDDARELDRDVQAYYREQRAERRRLRHHRLHARIARDGIVLPVLACCLIFALIAGTLLTIFTATSDQNLISGGPASLGAPAPSRIVLHAGKPLPAGSLSVDGTDQSVRLQSLGETMLVLVRPRCQCGATVSWLAGIAASRDVPTYLVGTPQTISEARQLHSGLTADLQTAVAVALDRQGVLAHTYPVAGVTAVLIAVPGQTPLYAQHLSAKDSATPLLQGLGS